MTTRIAFQGEPGAYSEAAALAHYGEAVELVACESFEGVFVAVQSGATHGGVIPIENTLAGSIHHNYDLLRRYALPIVGEHHLRVRHCLIAHAGVALADLRTVLSHPQALAQCEQFLRALPQVTAQAAANTAGSVKAIKDSGDRTSAAIASHRAAEIFGLSVLVEGIEDNPANFTRFLAIERTAPEPEANAKTSIVFTVQNIPGALFKAMSAFALRDIDLNKIESRPLVGQPWEYLFYVDFTGSTTQPVVQRALDHLREYALTLQVLGSYPRHHVEAP